MRVIEEPDGKLVISNNSAVLTGILYIVAAILAGCFLFEWFGQKGEHAVGLIASCLMFLAGGVVFFERSRFEFDPSSQQIEWSHQRTWCHRTGQIKFDQVMDVLVESPIGDHGVPSRRIALRIADSPDLPLVAAFVPDHDRAILILSHRLRELIGLEAGDPVVDSALALIRADRVTDAVELLRRERSIKYAEAKQQVDELRSQHG